MLTSAAPKLGAELIGYYTFGPFVPADPANVLNRICDGTYGNFSLTETGIAPNGCVSSPDTNTIVLTGTLDGSGLAGTTDFTILAGGTGDFTFSFNFHTEDVPPYESAGYLLDGVYKKMAVQDGDSGGFTFPVVAGELIGFRVESADDAGFPGVLTITDFRAPEPVPEPGSAILLCTAVLGAIALRVRRVRPALRKAAAPLLLVSLVAGMAPAAFGQQIYYSGNNVTGQLALVRTVNLRQQAQPLAAQSLRIFQSVAQDQNLLKNIPRLTPTFSTTSTPALSAKIRLGAPLSSATTPALSVQPASGIFGFNALSHLDQRNAYNGNQFNIEPPNQSIAVGNGYILEGVNNAVQVYNMSGVPSLPLVLAANQVFGLPPTIDRATLVYGVFLTDMRVFFDQDISRWFVVMRSQDNDSAGNPLNSSHLYIAVSQTADPTATYNIYVMDTTNPAHLGCPCIDDYPQIGADQYGFHIAWNEFRSVTLQYVDASILSLSKASLASGSLTPTAFQFLVPNITGFEFSLQPASVPPGAANYIGSGGLEYFASTAFTGPNNSQIALWAMYNTSSLASSNPAPGLTRILIPTLTYTPPPTFAPQPSGTYPLGTSLGAPLETLDGGDTRVQALTYSAARLYLTFQTAVTDQNGAALVGGAYIVLAPTYRGGVLAAQIVNQGYLMVPGNHLLRPAVAVNPQGVGAIAVTLVGNTQPTPHYPSAALIPFQMLATPSTVQVAAPGALPEDGFSGYPFGGGYGIARWGDYNTAVAASDGSIWMTVEYIGNYPRAVNANWNTYIVRK